MVECKSWAIGASAFTYFKSGRTSQSGSFSQFTSYLKNGISTMAGLEYWFDGKKITGASDEEGKKTLIKDEFKSMMLDLTTPNQTTLTDQGNDVFDAIWANTALRGNLWSSSDYPNITESQAKPVFLSWVLTLDNKIFKFIKVK